MTATQTTELARGAYWKAAGELLRGLRERHGWSAPDLAARAGVTADLVVAYERARVRYPEVEACWRLTAALGIGLGAFLREVERRSGVSLAYGVPAPAFTAPPVDAPPSAREPDDLNAFIGRLRAKRTGGP